MSTTLPHGIIQINEGNISWYGDITANWQLIDSKIGVYDAAIATIPAPANNGTLTINYGGATIAMFGADDAGNVTADIPTPGDGTLTVTVNGTAAGTFSANQAGNANVNIAVPTRTSQLANDSGYLTSSSNLDASKLTSGTVDIARLPQGALERLVKVANEAARYALTIADVQLGDTVQQLDTGIMYVVTDTDHLDSAAGYTEYTAGTAASVPWSGVTGKPTFAAVATSGAYSDLTGTPTIPTVNNATLTIQQNGTNVQTFTANQSTNATANITVPTKTSDLTNDSGFITSDNTKIPLAGSNQISGDLIPVTDNTYALGSSAYRFKYVYTGQLITTVIGSTNGIDSIYFSTEGTQERTFRPTNNGAVLLGASFSRWKEIWCTQSSINSSSDERQKQQIKPIDDDLLDAWENVNPIEFKWNDAVKEKGDNARVHTGYIAQNIQQALTENGVNPNDYGLFLYDEWDEEQEEKDEQGNIVRPYRPSGNAYGLRYTEALIVECAYLRKKNKDLQEQLNALSERLEKLGNSNG